MKHRVLRISDVSTGIPFAAISARTKESVFVYGNQKPIDGKLSYGQVKRDTCICEIYNPDFEVSAI